LQIRVLPGAQKELTADNSQLFGLKKASEPIYANEQFIDLVRFEQRSKLDGLPEDWKKVGRDVLLK
jgi:hypothetical protein